MVMKSPRKGVIDGRMVIGYGGSVKKITVLLPIRPEESVKLPVLKKFYWPGMMPCWAHFMDVLQRCAGMGNETGL